MPNIAQTAGQYAGPIGGVLIASGIGTTNATIYAATTVAHGATQRDGTAFAAASLACIAFPTNGLGNVYQAAPPTATVIDIRSGVTAIPYVWYLFVVA